MVFRDAAFELKICSPDPSPLSTTGGFDIAVPHGLQALSRADIVILPTWHDDCRPAPATLLEALRRAHRRGARIVGLCLGAFPLAEAGMLDGRAPPPTGRLPYAGRAHPAVSVDREVLYVDDDVLTSAGVAAGLDCCLHLLRELCGAEAANHVARQLVVAPHRQGGRPSSSSVRCRSAAATTALRKCSTGSTGIWPTTTASTRWPRVQP
jgi:transcriptional regulator GlxA family with amidase domain